ncbi:MAG: hypothetical protein A2Y53_03815 [Chloroflexi bacterium RBG_16_47_49]|nr:MAG: hypothetical protein A2Y53_03815 [Chloroflexi bacterium RBG_16_47_49]
MEITQKIRIHDLDENTDYEYEPQEPISTEDICDQCGGNIIKYFTANGPDDYDTVWECLGCGETWSS